MKVACFILALLIVGVSADMYMHNPPGSNDRNRERNDNRNNGNRLFDSQNNGKGGYPWRGNARIKGGPDPLTYYTGSTLRIEWTNQHGCGLSSEGSNVVCEIVIQYGCDTQADNLRTLTKTAARDFPGLRDGYPNSQEPPESADDNNPGYLRRRFEARADIPGQVAQNQDGTNTIGDNVYPDDPTRQEQFYTLGQNGGVEFGMHEHYDNYMACKTTERNNGLYNADQILKRKDARATRQNPNGARRGLECPEERDYYPYWNNKINNWHDIAILTDNLEKCDYYKQNSPNVRAYGWCTMPGASSNNPAPITREKCLAMSGTWNPGAPLGGGPPDCALAPLSRDNHLGNAVITDPETGLPLADEIQPETAHYNWEIPADLQDKVCVVRVRYNMSTHDYPSDQFALKGSTSVGLNASYNCPRVATQVSDDGQNVDDLAYDSIDIDYLQCKSKLTENVRPLTNRPYVQVFLPPTAKLAIALNTHQSGRTFQDRSYVFNVMKAPVAGKIWNLNTRGRRGNIVQCYPAVEYDFVPSQLKVEQGDYVHIQFHGSDFNAAKNANNGEGWQYSDRHNMVEIPQSKINFPTVRTKMKMFPKQATALRWALLDQENCGDYYFGKAGANNNKVQNAFDNCGKLNAAPNVFPPNPSDGLQKVGKDIGPEPGTYHYVSTRNNNFSNRSHKAMLIVKGGSGLSQGQVAGIAVGTVAVAGLAVAGICFWGKKNPHTKAGEWYKSCAGKCQGMKGTPSTTAPDTPYTNYK